MEPTIKVLPEHFADDGERLRRFEREAKTLASSQLSSERLTVESSWLLVD